ncbi:MAG TPA: ribosome-associated translation inhibitor RaiA [Vitreimonas sp.]|uniref:ribosome hibernation-promoting factor, HPF/YfiA family n=1 Tax=Vitreimonas sp. TaxID=3069702 RepID=UPI002D71BDAD|nr:ribosome-associated translation inhibitor RaiA [Vitreimonas sp.]HYD87842.1 ribosome-associated translation inhibitor RaiA [Vitreimonas sp.]
MRIQVAGRQMDVGEALRTRIETELAAGVGKYFDRATDAVVTVAKNGGAYVNVDCTVHLFSGITLQAEGQAGDAHSAFDDAMNKLEKRVRRFKRRLRDHHASNRTPLPFQDASAYVLASFGDEEEADEGVSAETESAAPLVIAESTVQVRTMTVSMAVLQLELSKDPALMFRNAAHGGLSVVYRRGDGNIGWIDPERDSKRVNNGGG